MDQISIRVLGGDYLYASALRRELEADGLTAEIIVAKPSTAMIEEAERERLQFPHIEHGGRDVEDYVILVSSALTGAKTAIDIVRAVIDRRRRRAETKVAVDELETWRNDEGYR